MSLLNGLFGPSKEKVWRQLAEKVEGRFIEGGLFGQDAVQVSSGDWIITLDTYSDDDMNTYTRLRAPFVNPEGFSFTIYRAGFFDGLGKLMGIQDIKVSYPRFDRRYVIKGNSEHRVRTFFENDRIRELIDLQPRIELKTLDHKGWFKSKFPDGVDELRFRRQGVLKDLRQLESLFALFTESLHQLCHGGKADGDDVIRHIRRLRGPGGEILDKHILWDGDPPRRDAADALGRLKDPQAIGALTSVLGGGDTQLRAHAIDALASIGHQGAIGPLVRCFGDASRVDGKPIRDRLADALASLGEGELVHAMLAALSGDVSRLREAVEEYRAQALDAFVSALDGGSGMHAARALEELHALEALPELREVLRRTGTKGPVGAAIEATIRELEARSSLPRPAAGRGPVADTLPRVADDPGPATDTLPRVVEEGE